MGENVKPIKTPFTVAAVKLYRDFSTHDMNNNHAFFSVIAKPTAPVRPFAGRIIAGRRPWAGGPCRMYLVPRQAWESGGRFQREPAGICPPPPSVGLRLRGRVHSNLQRPGWDCSGLFQNLLCPRPSGGGSEMTSHPLGAQFSHR